MKNNQKYTILLGNLMCLMFFILMTSCAGSGRYQTTRSHYTPNLANQKLNVELAWLPSTGFALNTGTKISKHWGVLACLQTNIASYNAKELLGDVTNNTKEGYTFDIGGNFNAKIGKDVNFALSVGAGKNDSKHYEFYPSYRVNITQANGYYWYIQPYLVFCGDKKIKYNLSCRYQNYDFDMQKTYSSNLYPFADKANVSYLSGSAGLDVALFPNLNLNTQAGLEISLNLIQYRTGSRDYSSTMSGSIWAKIGVQFILPHKK